MRWPPFERSLCVWLLAAATVNLLPAAEIKPGTSAESRYHVNRWTAENGLPQNTVRCLLQSRDGYLWIGTRTGLARFDGARFTVFSRATTPVMANDNCVALAEDGEGRVWIGTEGGLLQWKDRRFTAFAAGGTDLSHASVRSLWASGDGGVWIGTQDGLYHFRDGKFAHYSTADDLHANNIRAVCEDAQGTVWVGTEIDQSYGGLRRKSRGFGRFVSLENYGTSLPFMVHFITADRAGNVWWGNNSGLHRFGTAGLQDYGLEDGLSGQVVKWIHQGRGESLTVVAGERVEIKGRRGLHRLSDERISRIELTEFGVEDDVICAIEDFEGTIWAGTRHDGLIQIHPKPIRSFTTRDGLFSDTVNSVCAGKDGSVWVATPAGLNLIRGEQILSYSSRLFLMGDAPQRSLCEDGDGAIWVGYPSGELRGLRDSTRLEGHADIYLRGRGQSSIGVISTNRLGNLWVGFQGGICQFHNDSELKPKFFSTDDGLSTNDVRAILEDRYGDMWFGTYGGGVNRLREGKFTAFTMRDGLSSDRAWALHEDPEGILWVGTERGLNRIKNGIVRALTTQEGLFDNRVNQILEDAFGYFWISCNHGVFKVRRQECNEVAEGRISRVNCIAYGEADGMASAETTSEHQPVGCRSCDGRLWFATPKGLTMIDPKTLQDNTNPPPVVIEQVKADEVVIVGDGLEPEVRKSAGKDQGPNPKRQRSQSLVTSAATRLGPGRARALNIRYTANSFIAPEKVRFKYRLDGYDQEWREPDGPERVAHYTNLRPGNYSFQVIACNNHGYWNHDGARFAFSLAPKFTQTVWFPVSCAVGLLALSGALAAWRLRWQHRLSKLEQQGALANERTRIARDLHDDLGTALTGLALELHVIRRETQQAPSAAERLEETAEHTRDLAERMREVVWAVNPRCDTVSSLASFLEQQTAQFLRSDAIRGRFEFPDDIPPLPVESHARHQLALGVREALTNVVRHAHATEVVVSLVIEAHTVVVRIADNGCGFHAEKHPNRRECGHGLANLRERLERIQGSFECSSMPGRGTTVTFRVPLQQMPKSTGYNGEKTA